MSAAPPICCIQERLLPLSTWRMCQPSPLILMTKVVERNNKKYFHWDVRQERRTWFDVLPNPASGLESGSLLVKVGWGTWQSPAKAKDQNHKKTNQCTKHVQCAREIPLKDWETWWMGRYWQFQTYIPHPVVTTTTKYKATHKARGEQNIFECTY